MELGWLIFKMGPPEDRLEKPGLLRDVQAADRPCAHQWDLHGGGESSTLCARFGWDEKSENQMAAKVYFK